MNKRKIMTLIKFMILLVVAGTMLIPMLWSLSISLQPPGVAFQFPPKFFQPPLLFENYKTVFTSFNFMRYTFNSLLICICAIVGAIISNSMIAFGLAKYESKGLNRLFFIGLCTMYIPSVTMMVPSFVLWSKIKALDTYFPLILPAFFGSISWIFFMRQNFKGISNAFFEAAYIDGATPIYIFWKIYMPLSKPTIAYIALMAFLDRWNDMMGPLLYITSKDKYPIALALASFRHEFMGREELNMAATMMTIFPILVVYIFLQKHFVAGLQSAGVKE